MLGRINPHNVANHAPGFESAVIYPARDLDSTCTRPWCPRAPRPSPVTPLRRALSRCARSSRTGIPLWLLIWSVGHKGLSRCDLPSRSEISLYTWCSPRGLGAFKRGHAEGCVAVHQLPLTHKSSNVGGTNNKRTVYCSSELRCHVETLFFLKHSWIELCVNSNSFYELKIRIPIPPIASNELITGNGGNCNSNFEFMKWIRIC